VKKTHIKGDLWKTEIKELQRESNIVTCKIKHKLKT